MTPISTKVKPDINPSYEESRRQLKTAMSNGNLVLFIGAGASIASGMPSWNYAVGQIAKRLGIAANPQDILKIPQYYYNQRGKKEYTSLMRELFRYKEALKPGDIHDLILKFNVDTIITTNYDNLIELAAEKNNSFIYPISNDKELPYKHGKELIKMHGDFEHDNFVLREDDYLNYDRNFKLIRNYITSLIGTKTVLFIGYGFNDPDIKQIFSWLKDALHDDFQRAYMISVDDYDENVADYFKNFGINVLYSRKITGIESSEDKSSLLTETLEWILADDEIDLLDSLYYELRPFGYLNKPFINYIKDILRKYNIDIDEIKIEKAEDLLANCRVYYSITYIDSSSGRSIGINDSFLKENGNNSETDKIWILFLKIYYVYYHSGYIRNFSEELSECQIFKAIAGENSDQKLTLSEDERNTIRRIIDIFEKIGIKQIVLSWQKNENSSQKYILTSGDISVPEISYAIETFDYNKIADLRKYYEDIQAENADDYFMKLAHLYYLEHDFLKAYNCLKKAANFYYSQPNYAKYFIAKFDQHSVGRIVERESYKYDKDVINKVKLECEDINFDRILISIPDLSSGYSKTPEKNKFLNDVSSFSVAYTLQQELYRDENKAKEEADTSFFIYGGKPAYEKLRSETREFFDYQTDNHILFDNYIEIISIYKRMALSILLSVTATDKVTDEGFFDFGSSNIHAGKLEPFDLEMAIRYTNYKDLKNVLNDKKEIPTDSGILQYIAVVANNMFGFQKNDIFYDDTRYFWNLLYISSFINLDAKCIHALLKMLIKNKSGLNRDSDYKFVAWKFLNQIKTEKDALTFKEETESDSCDQVVKDLVDIVDNGLEDIKFPRAKRIHNGIFYTGVSAAKLLKKIGKPYKNIQKIKEVINNKESDKDLLTDIYLYCDANCKSVIREWFTTKWKCDDTYDAYLTYSICVQDDIFPPDKETESCALHYIKTQVDLINKEKSTGTHKVDKKLEHLVYLLLNLSLFNKLNDKDELKRICASIPMYDAVWFLDMHDEENFKHFDPKWLSLCGDSLLESISKDEELKKKIADRLKSDYLGNKLDKDQTRQYIEFFT